MPSSKYRPEIDGLRAFAVVSVIINHFNKNILPGGYLGVDIFFVISGYVITSSLYDRPSKDFKDFISGFYERRIKRLVPALSIFVLSMSIAICLFDPNPQLTLRTGITSLFGLSNLYLQRSSTDYFAQSTDFNVFTHTWSLGVEEQFYILFPFFVWFSGFGRQTNKGPRNLFLALGALSIASLIGFLYFYSKNQPAAYFLMPWRFWEIAAGSLIFIGFQKRPLIQQLLQKVPSLLVLVLIILVMFLPISLATTSTIAVVALSSVLIAALKEQTAAFKIFTNPKVVYVGLISYSLYLWHWGVLSISRWTIGIHWWSVPLQVAVIYILALASYRWIETPLRKRNSLGKRWKTFAVGGSAVMSVFVSLITLTKLHISLYTGEGYSRTFRRTNFASCEISNEDNILSGLPLNCGEQHSNDSVDNPTIYAIGDSHVWQFGGAIAKHAANYGYNYKIIWGQSCIFPSGVVINNNTSCFDKQSKLEDSLIEKIGTDDIVFVGSALIPSFSPEWVEYKGIYNYSSRNGLRISQKDAVKVYSHRFRDFSKKISTQGGKIVLLIDPVLFVGLESPGRRCSKQWFRNLSAIPEECYSSLKEYSKQVDRGFYWRHDWEEESGNFVFDAYLYAENCEDDICEAALYSDSDHIIPSYAERLFNKFIADNPSLMKMSSDSINYD